ncbi:MAG: hypothetical protein JG771_625, partial [Methermicoccus sp.]|nr:hypothetical protein [Methermicoccus sp.]
EISRLKHPKIEELRLHLLDIFVYLSIV